MLSVSPNVSVISEEHMKPMDVDDSFEGVTEPSLALNVCTSKLCMVCEESPMQYKCPRCDYLTCSLKCCKQHKIEVRNSLNGLLLLTESSLWLGTDNLLFDALSLHHTLQTQCTGKRDRAAFVSVKDFKEKNLRSDFHFLEDILQTKDSALRTLSLNCGGRPKDNTSKDNSSNAVDSLLGSTLRNVSCTPSQQLNAFPSSIKRLAKAAISRNIQLIVMPQGMSKRTLNTTQYRPKTDLILWRLHVVFVINNSYEPSSLLKPESQSSQNNNIGEQSSSSSAISVTEEALVAVTLPVVEESKMISDILADFLSLRAGNSVCRHALRSLRPHRDGGTLRCLIQHIPSPSSSPLFCEVPLDSTLKTVLEGRTVIEYPTIFFGSIENTSKLRMRVAVVSEQGGTDVKGEEVVCNEDGSNSDSVNIIKDGEDKEGIKQSIIPSSSSASDSVNNRKRTAEYDESGGKDDGEENNVRQRVRSNDTGPTVKAGENGAEVRWIEERDIGGIEVEKDEVEGEEEEEEEEEEDEEVFLSALKEFEAEDIDALKAYILAQEQS